MILLTPIEILINIIFSTGSMIGFFYVYKKTLYIAALICGINSYIELIYRTFMGQIPIITHGLDLMIIPETILMIYFAYIIYKDGFRYIPIMIAVLFLNFLLLSIIGHKFYGEIGIGFMLILIIWVSQSSHPCKVNPWSCRHCE